MELDTATDLRAIKPHVAFVIQRCGREVNGGAEALCLKIAQRMTRHWRVEILTTCALDYMTWEDHYPAGSEQVDEVVVRRFPVSERRNVRRFDEMSETLTANRQATLTQQEGWMRRQGPWSPRLFQFIAQGADEYQAFLFFGYLYAQTYFGLPAVASKAVLVPLAHDEWMIQLSLWDAFFKLPAGFIFNSDAELDFLRTRFPRVPLNGPVLGVAVERPTDIDPTRFRHAHHIELPYLLYVGRIDPSKGCATLFQHFLRHVHETGDSRQLVLLGKTVMAIPSHPQIVSLGFVDEQTKWDALAGCDLLIMPSPFESLSIALLEAWSVAKPVLVNGDCAVLNAQCRRANGGVWYRTYEEFSAALSVLCRGHASDALGRQGYSFVNSRYRWPEIELGYIAAVDAVTRQACM